MNIYTCPVCGYSVNGDNPPASCPKCGVPGQKFVKTVKVGVASKSSHCKSCGGELEKDGNVYVCKQCGEAFKNEYVAEHGNIEVHKKVKKNAVNFSEEKKERLNNLYTIARRAKF